MVKIDEFVEDLCALVDRHADVRASSDDAADVCMGLYLQAVTIMAAYQVPRGLVSKRLLLDLTKRAGDAVMSALKDAATSRN